MADKEATIYIVDVGKSMGECRNRRSITDLEYAMQYVWDRITATVRILPVYFAFLLLNLATGGYWPKNCYTWCTWSEDRW